jgi:hypothetical protein
VKSESVKNGKQETPSRQDQSFWSELVSKYAEIRERNTHTKRVTIFQLDLLHMNKRNMFSSSGKTDRSLVCISTSEFLFRIYGVASVVLRYKFNLMNKYNYIEKFSFDLILFIGPWRERLPRTYPGTI